MPKWMPSWKEWDYRSLSAAEAAVACCWEYARSSETICSDPFEWSDLGMGHGTKLGWIIWYGEFLTGVSFPDPWLDMSLEMRAKLLDAVTPHKVYIAPFEELLALLERDWVPARQRGVDPMSLIRRILCDERTNRPTSYWPAPSEYLLSVNFETTSKKAIKKALVEWVDMEAKRFPRRRRGKPVAAPLESLKWLAALRLDEARLTAGVSFAALQSELKRWETSHLVDNASPTLPIYDSHGAWSKAKHDAIEALAVLETQPVLFEKRLLDVSY